MLPPVCINCGRCFAEIEIPYLTDLRNIDYSELSTEEKSDQKAALLNKYHIYNYCCRMRVLGQVRLVEVYT